MCVLALVLLIVALLVRSTEGLHLGSSTRQQAQSQSRSIQTQQQRSHNRIYSSSSEDADVRTFAAYVVYKGKGAVAVKPIPPTFSATITKQTGTIANQFRTVAREGTLLFEFAPPGMAARQYNWEKKSSFALNPTECGELLCMDKTVGKEFFHDPNLGSADSGKVQKKMTWTPTADKKGMFLSLQVSDKQFGQFSCSIPISWGEFEVIKTIASVSLPRFLGIDKVLEAPGMPMAPMGMNPPGEAPAWSNLSDGAGVGGPTW